MGVEGGRGGCSKVFRLCEHAQEAFSRPPCPPTPSTAPPHPWSYNLAAPSSPAPPPHHLQLQLRQFSSNHEAGTFNLTECSRHLNYLTVVLVRGGVTGRWAGGHAKAKVTAAQQKAPELYPPPGQDEYISFLLYPTKGQQVQMVCYLCHREVESNLFLLNRTVLVSPD